MGANMIHVRKTDNAVLCLYLSSCIFILPFFSSHLSLNTSQTFWEAFSLFIFHAVSQSNFISGIFTFYNIEGDSCIKH